MITSAGAGDWRLADVFMVNDDQHTEDLLSKIERHGSWPFIALYLWYCRAL